MRRRLRTALCSLVALFALAPVVARAQGAAQSSAQAKKTPARQAAKKTPAAKKSSAAKETGSGGASKGGDAGAAGAQTPASGEAAPSQTPAASSDATKAAGEAEKKDAVPQSKAGEAEKKKDDAAQPKAGAASKSAKPQAAKGQKKPAEDQPRQFDPAKAAELKSKLDEIQKLASWERIAELRDFLDQDLPDDLADRATERLVSAEAAYGDERLKAGDAERGVKLFRDAVADADEDISDWLFYEVVSQLPANLVLRGQPDAAFDIARRVEKIARGDAKRLLAVAAFYVTAEMPDEAARLSSAAIKLQPDLPAAHQGLAAADRLALKLDESAAEYARAAELDPKSAPARGSLADMKRATGKPEEALAIYRELLASDPQNRAARDGVVLALFDTGKREEAERELDAALKDDPRDVQLLAGAAYWYAARGDGKRALDLAGRAVQIEPRHPWAQVALARALIAGDNPSDAERALRFARLYARFPTLDYELANALAAEGFYAEAAEELARTFALKGDRIETRLAGRTAAGAPDFIELLSPERRASLFEPDAAETPENARRLKALLALNAALRATETDEQRAAAESPAAQSARDFAAGDDRARAFRQLYAANRLLRRNVATPVAVELVNAARRGVEDAVSTPQATAAVTADELRSARAAAIAQGTVIDIPDAPRDVLDHILRGRIEELTGWALMNQGRAKEAVAPLRQAVGVLPENSLYWREALWRLGNAYAAAGQPQLALNSYVKSFDQDNPDEARFAVIQSLYRKLNGNLNGLEVLFGLAPSRAASANSPSASQPAAAGPAQPWAASPAKPEDPKNAHAPTPDQPAAADRPAANDTAPTGDRAATGERPAASAAPRETKAADPTDAVAKDDAAKSDTKAGAKPETKGDGAKPAETRPVETKPAETKPDEAKAESKDSGSKAEPKEAASSKAGDVNKAGDAKRGEAEGGEAKGTETTGQPAASDAAAAKSAGAAGPSPAARRGGAGECALAVESEAVSLKAGASASFLVSLEGGGDPSKITATTPNWSDILVLREPAGADAGAIKFTVTSISKGAGDYGVTIKSPCGSKKIMVTVK
jgi:tetratricopeptide (TPR) repeat protein